SATGLLRQAAPGITQSPAPTQTRPTVASASSCSGTYEPRLLICDLARKAQREANPGPGAAGVTQDGQIKAENVLAEYADWSGGFIKTNDFIDTL
ncbi:MAG: hypothetical protein AAFX85_12885, partial [Pseudomonadota bacterium]